MKGIEPSSKAWEAFVLPLNYTRVMLKPNSNGGEGVVSGAHDAALLAPAIPGAARNRAAHVQQQSPGLLLVEPSLKIGKLSRSFHIRH